MLKSCENVYSNCYFNEFKFSNIFFFSLQIFYESMRAVDPGEEMLLSQKSVINLDSVGEFESCTLNAINV